MKRIPLWIGAAVWLVVWVVFTSLSDRHANVSTAAMARAEPARGERVASACAACHSLDRTEPNVGPHLVGVVGRPAGSVAGYDYSPALRASGITWTRDRLRTFLMHPETVVPGTRMALTGWSAEDAEAVIDHLAATTRQSPRAQGSSSPP